MSARVSAMDHSSALLLDSLQGKSGAGGRESCPLLPSSHTWAAWRRTASQPLEAGLSFLLFHLIVIANILVRQNPHPHRFIAPTFERNGVAPATAIVETGSELARDPIGARPTRNSNRVSVAALSSPPPRLPATPSTTLPPSLFAAILHHHSFAPRCPPSSHSSSLYAPGYPSSTTRRLRRTARSSPFAPYKSTVPRAISQCATTIPARRNIASF